MGIGTKALLTALAVITADLGTKALAVVFAGQNDLGPITPRANPEFALGIVPLSANPMIIAVLTLCTVLVTTHTIVLVRNGRLTPTSGVMLLAGALANGIDRLATGVVHDFINLGVIIANVADGAIVWGVIAYLVVAWRSFDEPSSPHKVDADDLAIDFDQWMSPSSNR